MNDYIIILLTLSIITGCIGGAAWCFALEKIDAGIGLIGILGSFSGSIVGFYFGSRKTY